MHESSALSPGAILCALLAVLCLPCAPGHAATDTVRTPLRALVVTIVAQDGFLTWLLDDAVRAGTLPPLTLMTAHVRDLRQLLEQSDFDIVIAHEHARPAQRLEQHGVLVDGHRVFANPMAILGPVHDPAAIAGANSFADVIERLRAHEACWVINQQDGKDSLQQFIRSGSVNCIVDDPDLAGAAAVVAAQKRGAYTLWGFHPYTRLGLTGMRAFVTADPRMLRPLRAWTVAASGRREEVRAVVDTILDESHQRRLATFRLTSDSANQPWWPVTAVAADDASGAARTRQGVRALPQQRADHGTGRTEAEMGQQREAEAMAQ